MAVDPPAPKASTSALPPAPTSLLVVMTINGNSRIIPAPAFVPKGLPAAIAAKPIPRRYTSSTETRPGIWVNAEKACNLADHMEVTPTISMLKRCWHHPPASGSLPEIANTFFRFCLHRRRFPLPSGKRDTIKASMHWWWDRVAWQPHAATNLC